jgi:SpoVK/Ycf46/Vps4 family AAA+-type ATPase
MPPEKPRTPPGGYAIHRQPTSNDRDKSQPTANVPRGQFDDEELTPVRAILRLEEKLDNHMAKDELTIENIHQTIRDTDTRFGQKHDAIVATQGTLMTETSKQTVMLTTLQSQWDNERADRRALAAAARKELDIKRQTRTKYILLVLTIVGPLIVGVVTYHLTHGAVVPSAETKHEP